MKSPHCIVLYKENERRGRLSSCPEPVLGFLIMQTGSALQSISSTALFWEAQERGADKGARWTVSGPHLGRCQPRYLQHPFWLHSDTQCAEEGKCSPPALSVLRNVVSCGRDPREEAHQNRHRSFSPLCEWHFVMVSNPSANFYQALKTLTSGIQVLRAQMDLKFGIMLLLSKTCMHKAIQITILIYSKFSLTEYRKEHPPT